MQRESKWLLFSTVLLASFGLGIVALWPQLDLAVSAAFFEPSLVEPAHGFLASPILKALRRAASLLPYLILIIALGASWRTRRATFPRGRAIAFLLVTFALGPGLLVNGVLKREVHRPRPVHVAVFGGEAAFQPFDQLAGPCPKNCSFPSGEAAAAFWTVAPALLVSGPAQGLAVGAALLFGLGTGLLRIAVGAHFLSDVLFSAALMAGLIGLIFVLLRPKPATSATKPHLHGEAASL